MKTLWFVLIPVTFIGAQLRAKYSYKDKQNRFLITNPMKGEINMSAELSTDPKYRIPNFVLLSLFFPQTMTEKSQLIF